MFAIERVSEVFANSIDSLYLEFMKRIRIVDRSYKIGGLKFLMPRTLLTCGSKAVPKTQILNV